MLMGKDIPIIALVCNSLSQQKRGTLSKMGNYAKTLKPSCVVFKKKVKVNLILKL